MEKYLLHPAKFKLDGGAMFGIIPKPLWQKKITPDEDNRIDMALRVVLIITENHKILIDTGIGDYHNEKFQNQFNIRSKDSPLEAILKDELNISTTEITDIILTHLHFDHVGGLGGGENGKEIIFPNATIHTHKKHFEYSQNPTLRDSGSFHVQYFNEVLEYYQKKSQIHFLEEEAGTIIKDGEDTVKYKVSFGHTPYMVHPIADDLIYMADLVPMSHHVRIPWVMGYDIEPGTTTVYKKEFYDHIIKNDLKMIFEHDNDVWGGPLKINERGQFQLKEKLLSNQQYVQRLE